ncbi:hypothetical protein, partial [Pseudomonas syringae group genomosp. 3]
GFMERLPENGHPKQPLSTGRILLKLDGIVRKINGHSPKRAESVFARVVPTDNKTYATSASTNWLSIQLPDQHYLELPRHVG